MAIQSQGLNRKSHVDIHIYIYPLIFTVIGIGAPEKETLGKSPRPTRGPPSPPSACAMLDFDDLTPGILGHGCRGCLTYNQIYLPRAIQKKYLMVDKQSDHDFFSGNI